MHVFTELTDHRAVRRILLGVRDRTEGRVEPFARQMLEFALLLWAVITFLEVIWYVLRGSLTWRVEFVALVAGAAGKWYAPFSIVAALVVNVLAVWRLPSAGTRRISKFLRPMT